MLSMESLLDCSGSKCGIWLRTGTEPAEFHTLKSPLTTHEAYVYFSFLVEPEGVTKFTCRREESLMEKLLI